MKRWQGDSPARSQFLCAEIACSEGWWCLPSRAVANFLFSRRSGTQSRRQVNAARACCDLAPCFKAHVSSRALHRLDFDSRTHEGGRLRRQQCDFNDCLHVFRIESPAPVTRSAATRTGTGKCCSSRWRRIRPSCCELEPGRCETSYIRSGLMVLGQSRSSTPLE